MPRIFDNISNKLLSTLRATLASASHADFCVGYFNLRGWQTLDDMVVGWDPNAGQVCRVLIGMQRPPHDEVKELYRLETVEDEILIDNARASNDLRRNSKRRIYNYKHSGRVEYDEFYPSLSKSHIDPIDQTLSGHYGITAEELDYIINYDIKYRMGLNGGEADADD